MPKKQKTQSQKENDKKGKDRMERFTKNQSVDEDDYEERILIAYQKKDGNEWEKVEIPYKKRKK